MPGNVYLCPRTLHGGAAINVLARHTGTRVLIVDMGVVGDLPAHPGLIVRKIACGTADISQGPAMSRDQAEAGLLAGARIVFDEMEQGLDLLATGDMGIGNTTPSAAIAAALTGLPAEIIAGRGTGVDDAGLSRKNAAIQCALDVNQPDPEDGLDVLAKVGWFQIAGLAGSILAAAANRMP